MGKKLVTWVLVADGKRARVYSYNMVKAQVPLSGNAKNHHYEERYRNEILPIDNMSWQAESLDDFDIGNGKLATIFSSASNIHHTTEPHIDIHEEIKQHLAHKAALELNSAFASRQFDRIVLIAPSRTLEELKKYMDDRLLQRIAAELPKDLVKQNRGDLIYQLEEALHPSISSDRP